MQTSYLKLATAVDIPYLLKASEDLYEYSVYSTVSSFDREHTLGRLQEALEGDGTKSSIMVLYSGETPVGCLGAARTGFMGKDDLAVELLFWIEPEHRTKSNTKLLMQAYFYWAKLVGCTGALVGKMPKKNSPEYYKLRKL